MTRNITETKCFALVGGAAPERMLPQVSRAMVRTATRQILTTFRHETADSGQIRAPSAREPARILSNRSGVVRRLDVIWFFSWSFASYSQPTVL